MAYSTEGQAASIRFKNPDDGTIKKTAAYEARYVSMELYAIYIILNVNMIKIRVIYP